MNTVFTLLEAPPSMDLPIGPLGWIGLLCFSIIIATLQVLLRDYNKPWGKNERSWFILLLVLTPLASLLLGVRFPASDALPPPGIPVDLDGPTAMLLAAIPWTLAGGLLGPFPALLVSLLSGVISALWGTHNLYTIVEVVLLATLFSGFVNQRYRTYFYNLLRHPFIAAFSLALIYPIINLSSALFSTQGELVNRLDYAVTNLIAVSLAVGIELIVAGIISEVAKIAIPDVWVSDHPLVPAPEERSLLTRFIYYLSPIALALILALIISNWMVAGNAARGMLRERMSDTTSLVADNIPYFINTGQNLITHIANDPAMLSDDTSKIYKLLEEHMRTSAFFDRILLPFIPIRKFGKGIKTAITDRN